MAGVMRDAQSVDFGTPNTVNVAQDQTQYVQPNYTKYEGTAGRVKTSSDVGVSGFTQLIGAIAPSITEWGKDKIKTSQEEAYLNGQAAAAAGKSQDAVQSNIFTKDWATAGWSDTKGRLALADSDAQTAVDMQKLREQDPSAMQDYLNKRREQLMPLMDGMSMEARKGMVAQMLTSDQHAIAKHYSEHQKFIVDQQSSAITTGFSVANDAMNAAKNDPEAYKAATANAIANLWGNVWQNPNLPKANKQALIEQAATLALANNNESMYEQMRDMKDPTTGLTMLEQLPFNSQVSLAKAYQSSRKDTETMRNSALSTQLGLYESKLDNPLADPVPWEDHQAMVAQLTQAGLMTPEKQASLAKQWADGNEKKQKNTTAAAMFASGDVNGMFALGVTSEDAGKAWLATQQRKGVDVATATANLAQIGLTTGQSDAFKMVGSLMKSSIAQIGNTEAIDPGQLAGVQSVLGTIEQAEKKGNMAARTAFLSSFDDDTKARLLDFWSGLKASGNPAKAAADAATAANDLANMTPADKAALAQNHAKANQDIINSLTPKGFFAQLWEKNPFRFQDNVNRDKLRGDSTWGESSSVVEAATARTKVAVLDELNEITRQYPNMNDDDRKSMAMSNVANRTITTDGGPLTIPRGQTVQSFFGVDQSVSPQIVGAALSSMHEPAKGNHTIYQVSAAGQLQWSEMNKDGAIVNAGGVFDPKSVSAAIGAYRDRITDEYSKREGDGVVVKGDTGVPVQFNGNNTLGIGTNVGLQIRQDLVKYEGVRDTPYDDASGKIVNGKRVQTVGVGVSSHNKFYPPVDADGKVSPVNISRSFMQASNEAMVTANDSATKLPQTLQGPNTMRLYTQLAYQGGSVPKELVEAMKAGDRAGAMKALTESPQYKMAHTERRVFYTDLMRGIMPITY